MNKYFFILGNNKALSVAEILAWLENNDIKNSVEKAQKDFLILNIEDELQDDLLEKLGGTIKFGKVVDILDKKDIKKESLIKYLEPKDKKYNFGFSIYPENKKFSFMLRGVGLEIKKEFKSKGVSSRLVMSRQENLSSVIVQKNKMLGETGFEFVLLEIGDSFYIGKTQAVQPFEKLSQRDFGRPDRDDLSGMLPPKLAQVMINLGSIKENDLVLDPFCGSGTILQELLLVGHKDIFGSDVSEKAVSDTNNNLKWLEEKFSINKTSVRVVSSDIKDLNRQIETKVDRIVTEPFLGPPARGKRSEADVKKILNDLTALYKETFKSFAKILNQNARVVIIFPVLNNNRKDHFLPLDLVIPKTFKLINSLPQELGSYYRLSKRNTFIYERPNQQVKREILVFDFI